MPPLMMYSAASRMMNEMYSLSLVEDLVQAVLAVRRRSDKWRRSPTERRRRSPCCCCAPTSAPRPAAEWRCTAAARRTARRSTAATQHPSRMILLVDDVAQSIALPPDASAGKDYDGPAPLRTRADCDSFARNHEVILLENRHSRHRRRRRGTGHSLGRRRTRGHLRLADAHRAKRSSSSLPKAARHALPSRRARRSPGPTRFCLPCPGRRLARRSISSAI